MQESALSAVYLARRRYQLRQRLNASSAFVSHPRSVYGNSFSTTSMRSDWRHTITGKSHSIYDRDLRFAPAEDGMSEESLEVRGRKLVRAKIGGRTLRRQEAIRPLVVKLQTRV